MVRKGLECTEKGVHLPFIYLIKTSVTTYMLNNKRKVNYSACYGIFMPVINVYK